MQGSRHLSNFVCDLETSGSCPINNGIISATILVCDLNLNVIDEFRERVCPPDLSHRTWSVEAEGVHGKSIAEVMTYMSNDEFCYKLLCFLAKYKHPDNWPQPFICHASARGWKEMGVWKIYPWFDFGFLEWAFRKAHFENNVQMVWTLYKVFNSRNLISTVEMGRKAGYKKNGLKQWAERIGFQLNHHDDRSDALCCLEVYKYLLKNNEGVFACQNSN